MNLISIAINNIVNDKVKDFDDQYGVRFNGNQGIIVDRQYGYVFEELLMRQRGYITKPFNLRKRCENKGLVQL